MVFSKLHSLALRGRFFLFHWPGRGVQFLRHCGKGRVLCGWWWLELAVRFLELGGVFVVYETLADWTKWNTRPLKPDERRLAASFFGNSISLDQVRVDSRAFLGSRWKRFAYVSFHTINYWREINDSVMIHELVHIWQYEQLGAAYFVRALRGQWSREGYDYGGVDGLKGKHLFDFNFEQQAEIAMDYFRLKQRLKPRWGSGSQADLEWYFQILAPHFSLALG